MIGVAISMNGGPGTVWGHGRWRRSRNSSAGRGCHGRPRPRDPLRCRRLRRPRGRQPGPLRARVTGRLGPGCADGPLPRRCRVPGRRPFEARLSGHAAHRGQWRREGTAELLRGLMDGLGVDSFAVMCWSGGGPSAYQLAAAHPERVRSLVACAAVSGPYTFATGVARIERSLMSSGLGHHVLRALAEHTPKSLVASTVKEEGHLTDAEVEELTEHIWDHENTRDFVLDLSATLSGRRAGLKNDEHPLPRPRRPARLRGVAHAARPRHRRQRRRARHSNGPSPGSPGPRSCAWSGGPISASGPTRPPRSSRHASSTPGGYRRG